jgi:hypothetical protein
MKIPDTMKAMKAAGHVPNYETYKCKRCDMTSEEFERKGHPACKGSP